MSEGELVLYRTPEGSSEILLRATEGTVWLTQTELADLFDTTKQNVRLHLKNLFREGELVEQAGVKVYLTTVVGLSRQFDSFDSSSVSFRSGPCTIRV